MSLYKFIRNTWKKPKENLGEVWRERLIKFRREPVVLKLEKPTRLDRARSLGYKAKKGYVVARARVLRGGRQRPKFKGGRRSKHRRRQKIVTKNYQRIAEERTVKKFKNLEVLNSYFVAKDGKNYWYEIILVDPCRPEIYNDEKINWICLSKGRVFRGKTSAGRKGRGLRSKGKGAEKIRPSLRANRSS